jgi:hypothetical protein
MPTSVSIPSSASPNAIKRPSCTTGLTIGEILIDADAWSVARGCAEEAVAVAKAANVRLNVGRSDRAHPKTRRQNS